MTSKGNGVTARRGLGARRRAHVATCLGVAAALAAALPARADTTLSPPTTFTGSRTLSSTGLTATSITGVTATTDLVATLQWTQAATIDTTFDPNLVRQGRSLDPTDAYTRTSAGQMKLTWTLSNVSVSWDGIGPLDLGSPSFNATGACDLMADGSAYTCHVESGEVSIIDTYPVPGPYVKLGLSADVTITPAGIAALRQAAYDGTADGSGTLTLLESPITDPFAIPCTIPVGADLTYTLTQLSTTQDVTVVTNLQFDVGAELPNPLPPFNEIDVSFDKPTIPIDTRNTNIALAGTDVTDDLGAVQHNNIPPTVSAGGPYAGNEGDAITFDGSGSSSVCGFPTLVWNFSDGGVAYGAKPQHTFPGALTYSGEVTAYDATGLTAMTTFSVAITNLPPVVFAGPNTSSAWGRLVAFNGSATDPGTADQPTLTYSWDFGDGSPSASGGASTLHAYAAPGIYTAKLTSCDQYAACNFASRVVTVVKRSTTTSYLGDTSGTFDTPATLMASLVDEFGQTVNGRAVVFQVGTDGPFTALTGSSGIATRSYTPTLAAGSYTGSSSFAGDGFYNPSSTSNGFGEAKKATGTSYTGATSGGPNKTVVLSATLLDATGRPLGGRSVAFLLGTQATTATTNAFGVASTSLQLNQKNGTYSVSATYTPAGPDAADYVGSSQTAVFKLQSK